MPVDHDVQKLSPGAYVDLYELDATAIGGSVYRFVDPERCANVVTWNGAPYYPFAVRMEGFETTSDGPSERPRLYLTNTTKAMRAAIESWNKLRGAKITRLRTFAAYLDDGATPDPNAVLRRDVHYLNKVVEDNKRAICWECVPYFTFAGSKIPARQVLRGHCEWTYRKRSGGAWDYSQATCPYTGSACFDIYGNSVPAAEDRCGKKLYHCKLRYPGQTVKPFGGFPGVGLMRR